MKIPFFDSESPLKTCPYNVNYPIWRSPDLLLSTLDCFGHYKGYRTDINIQGAGVGLFSEINHLSTL